MAARSTVLYQRRNGEAALLVVRGVDAGYGDRQVLFDVDLDVGEGEIVALLGTNGAGKSTLLKAINGVVEADRGAIILDGRDITHAPPHEIAALGVAQVPGGSAVFGGLTVAENLLLARWAAPDAGATAEQARSDEVFDLFPVLAERADTHAADLSGGQQQMLALAMAFVARPRVLLVDELSLGLAPVIVGQLLPVVQRLAATGVAVVLVEQSVNVALRVAQRAVFMERGTIRFSGPTAELLDRPDLLRSVYLQRVADRPHDAEHEERPASTGTTVLRADGLVRRFGGIRAVDGTSFSVHSREVLGVIGPNGAGKTTVFDLISGFIPLDAGTIELAGRDVTAASPSVRAAAGLGRSFQDALLFPDLTVEEALKVAIERSGRPPSVVAAALRLPWARRDETGTAERADELLALTDLTRFRTSFVRELSTGTRRILDVACQFAHRPHVVLLDEPSSGIAQREVEALAPVLLRLRDELGAALVVIEHDIPLICEIADRLIALDMGRVIADGPPADVIADPRVVESYLGTTSAAIHRSGTGGPP